MTTMRPLTRAAVAALAFSAATAFVAVASADKLPEGALAQAEAGHQAGDPAAGHGTGTGGGGGHGTGSGTGGGGGHGSGEGTGGGSSQHREGGADHGTGTAAGGGGGHGTGAGTGGGANHGEPAREHGPDGDHDKTHPDPAAQHHAGGAHHLEGINWTDVLDKKKPAFAALVINLGILLTLYYWLGKKPVAEALKQRRVNIGKDIDDAERMLKEAEERAKLHQASLKNVEADAETAQTALVTAGKGEVQRMLEDAQERSQRMKRDAERLVEQERKQMRQDLLVETIELAAGSAESMLRKQATPQDHERLAEELLSELSKMPAAARGAA